MTQPASPSGAIFVQLHLIFCVLHTFCRFWCLSSAKLRKPCFVLVTHSLWTEEAQFKKHVWQFVVMHLPLCRGHSEHSLETSMSSHASSTRSTKCAPCTCSMHGGGGGYRDPLSAGPGQDTFPEKFWSIFHKKAAWCSLYVSPLWAVLHQKWLWQFITRLDAGRAVCQWAPSSADSTPEAASTTCTLSSPMDIA